MLKLLAGRIAVLFAAILCLLPEDGTAQTYINVPEALVGYYELRMEVTSPASPVQPRPDGLPIGVYITSFGTLCVDALTMDNPVLRGGLFGKAYWDIPESDLSFALDINSASFPGIDVLSLSGAQYGRLVGSLVTTVTGNCSEPPFNTRDANVFFDLAETTYPALFPASSFAFNQIGGGFDVFRYYPATETYLAVRDQAVFARGGDFGEEFIELGEIDDLLVDINTLFVPGRIPSFYHGTFVLDLTDTTPFTPLASGTQLTFVLTAGGQLCVGELSLKVPRVNAGATTATWSNPNGNIQYVLDLTRDDDPDDFDTNFPVGEFFFESASGTRFGTFEGDKTSLSTECADAVGTDPDLTSINELFGLAEVQYPAVFPSGPQTYNLRADGYTYRYYFDSQVFLAVKQGVVYLNGGEFGTNEEPVAYGTLSSVLSQLNDTPIVATVPSSSFGTYAMTFGSATPFSPFVNGTAVTVVLGSGGSLCLDGVSLGQPYARQSTPSLAIWENSDTGISLTLDLSALDPTTMTLDVNSISGLDFSTIDGDRTSLSTSCGSASSATNITLANQLFSLVETHYASVFPTSLLSFNQLDGNTVRRFYPATGMTLSITGEAVSIKGGAYGTSLVQVGQLSALIAKIIADATPPAPTPTPTPIYDMTATGTGVVQSLSTVNVKFDKSLANVTRPLASDTAALRALVEQAMSGTLTTFTSVSTTVTTDTATTLAFNATVTSNTAIAGSSTTRTYQLVFTLRSR